MVVSQGLYVAQGLHLCGLWTVLMCLWDCLGVAQDSIDVSQGLDCVPGTALIRPRDCIDVVQERSGGLL
jgi:hypothetical protein